MRALLLVLLLTGCASAPTVQPPKIECRQPMPERTPPAPVADAWLEERDGRARLSEEAVLWVRGVLGMREVDRKLWVVQEDCLDAYEAKGHIRR